MLYMLNEIDSVLKKYTEGFAIGNDTETLNPMIIAHVNETEKELILNDLDKKLPFNLNFSHQYKENGELKIIFKELI